MASALPRPSPFYVSLAAHASETHDDDYDAAPLSAVLQCSVNKIAVTFSSSMIINNYLLKYGSQFKVRHEETYIPV